MKRVLVLVSAAILVGHPAHAEPRALTLAEAVDMARSNAVGVARAEGASQSAAEGVRTAYGALLPTLSLSTGSTRQVAPTTAPWSSNLVLTTNLVLFDGGRRFFDLHQARATRISADADEGVARWDAVLAAKQAFFDVLAARETQVAAAATLQQAERQRWVAVERTRTKVAIRSDSLRAEIDVRSAQLEVLEASTARASADAALARAIGSLEPVTAAADSSEAALRLDDAALAALIEEAPIVQGARAHLQADREAQKGSWTAYLPSVSASWTHTGSGIVGPGLWGPRSLDYTGALRLSLNFTLFDQFRRESQVIQAGAAVRVAEAEVRDARLAARQQLVDGLGGYRAAAQRAASLSATVDAALEDLRMQSDRYALGGSTLLDVLASQSQLDHARRDLIRAHYDQRVAKAQLEALIGRDL